MSFTTSMPLATFHPEAPTTTLTPDAAAAGFHNRAVGALTAGVGRALTRTRAFAGDERGMSTIEYAMGSLAAAALAAALYFVVSSDAVRTAFQSIITDALSNTPS